MKNKAAVFLKQVISELLTILRNKSMAVRSKTSAIKTRLIILNLVRNKKVLSTAISHKMHALKGCGHDKDHCTNEAAAAGKDKGKAIVLYNDTECDTSSLPAEHYNKEHRDEHEEGTRSDRYPDLTHSLFDDDDELGDCTGSVIDLVRNSRAEDSDFRLEDEIDLVADMFIMRFHKQMRMQKQQSFKRYQEMLQRSV